MTVAAFPRFMLVLLAMVAGGVVAPADARAQRDPSPGFARSVARDLAGESSLFEEPEADAERELRISAADCSGAAAQAAAESGGQVLSVSSRQQGGRTVCVVTVLVPGQDGGRPRKRTITIPQ